MLRQKRSTLCLCLHVWVHFETFLCAEKMIDFLSENNIFLIVRIVDVAISWDLDMDVFANFVDISLDSKVVLVPSFKFKRRAKSGHVSSFMRSVFPTQSMVLNKASWTCWHSSIVVWIFFLFGDYSHRERGIGIEDCEELNAKSFPQWLEPAKSVYWYGPHEKKLKYETACWKSGSRKMVKKKKVVRLALTAVHFHWRSVSCNCSRFGESRPWTSKNKMGCLCVEEVRIYWSTNGRAWFYWPNLATNRYRTWWPGRLFRFFRMVVPPVLGMWRKKMKPPLSNDSKLSIAVGIRIVEFDCLSCWMRLVYACWSIWWVWNTIFSPTLRWVSFSRP